MFITYVFIFFEPKNQKPLAEWHVFHIIICALQPQKTNSWNPKTDALYTDFVPFVSGSFSGCLLGCPCKLISNYLVGWFITYVQDVLQPHLYYAVKLSDYYGWWSEILHQLRLVYVVYPVIYKVLYIPGGCLGFLNHQLVTTSSDILGPEKGC